MYQTVLHNTLEENKTVGVCKNVWQIDFLGRAKLGPVRACVLSSRSFICGTC